jgi:N-acetylglucosamine-6-phosphate deacetylase
MSTSCFGVDAATGAPVAVKFSERIEDVAVGQVLPGGKSFVAPGFIDLQVNGFVGVDYNRPSTPQEEIARSIQALFATGVTRFFATVITGAPDDMAGSLANLAAAKETLAEGAAIEGFHVEGPHISPDDGPRGAHPRRWVRPPDVDEFRPNGPKRRAIWKPWPRPAWSSASVTPRPPPGRFRRP